MSEMNHTPEQVDMIARTVSPQCLHVHRGGLVEVRMNAAVVDTERLRFDVSPKQIETALNSLVLSDSRGSTPNMFVHSPVTLKAASKQSRKAWTKVLTRYQGTKVGIETTRDKSEGILVGFRQELYDSQETPSAGTMNHSKFFIVIRSGSKVSFHPLESITALNFQDKATCEALVKDSFMKQYVVQRRNVYTIEVVAQGKGKGDIEIRYSVRSRFSPAYEVSYIFDVNEDTFASGVRRDRRLKCYINFHNPLDVDLSDVKVVFRSGQKWTSKVYWSYKDKAEEDEAQDTEVQDQDSASSKTEGDDNEEGREEEKDEKFVDEFSDVSYSTTTTENLRDRGNMNRELPTKVSLKMNESLKVLIFDKTCCGGIIRTIETDTSDAHGNVSLLLLNTTDERLESGHLQVNSTSCIVPIIFTIIPMGPNEFVLRSILRYSDIAWKRYERVDVGNQRSCHVTENQLVVINEKTQTMMGKIQNKSDIEVELFFFHRLCSRAHERNAIEGILTRASWLHSSDGENVQPFCYSSLYKCVGYLLKLRAREDCWMTVREQMMAKKKHMILEGLKSETVAHAEAAELVPPAALQSLRRLLSQSNELRDLKNEHWLHEEKLRQIEAYRVKGASKSKEGGIEDGENEENGITSAEDELQMYYTRSSAANKARAVLEGLMDDIERRLFEVRREMSATKRQLALLAA
eukprot:TRINITY_DN14402_c0_g4_i1.p1 TRINITY_DN14402_c0_g4~~TRINITY_DN14402_c0_g4_i1.p1  ORF type:complete len:690 (+),score=115.76 TRINITY_DN14402_c0_g4_i1:172-2241(+)